MADLRGSPENGEPEDGAAMTIFEHLAELRKRLILALIGLVPGVAVAWAFREYLLEFLLAPLTRAWLALGMRAPTIHFANPVDPLVIYMKIAVIGGLLISSPWMFWQIWKFVAPGLYDREQRLAIPFVISSTVCFAGGAFFGYGAVFPPAFEMFLGMAGMLPERSIDLRPTIMVTEYFDFATRMLLAFGLVFEIPVVVSFLALAGIVNWRQLLKFGRWWVLLAAILSALLTPPDVGSQLLMLGPLVLLYFLSVGIAYFVGPKPDRDRPAPDGERETS